ncbi:MAG: T9SS C-terminal target domain-containing protein [Chitinophagia bacterium]|nr:T9SS C-terminal target domain-containing protein [Chitinophagia bacterium]
MKKILLHLAIATFGFSVAGTAQTIIAQDFETASMPGLPTGWTDVHTGRGNGWETKNTAISLSYATIPAHTKYCVVNDGGAPANYPANLTSPTFSLATATAAYLSLDYNFQQFRVTATGRRETAWIDFSTDNGTTWTTLDSFRASPTWTKMYVSLGTSTSATCKVRFCYSDNRINATDTIGILGVAIDNVNIFNAPPTSITLESVNPVAGDPAAGYQTVGGAVTFGGVVRNTGSTNMTSFNATYQVGAGAPVTTPISCGSIPPMVTYTFTCTAYTMGGLGTQTVTTWVKETGDANAADDTMRSSITGVTSKPEKVILFEEPTGTWCQWCVRGIVYIDSIWQAHKHQVSCVAVHNGASEPMCNDNSSSSAHNTLMGTKISGYPSLVVDRKYVGDPSQVFSYYDAMKDWFAFAAMSIKSTVTAGKISSTVKVTPALNLTGDYRVELLIYEDRVHGTTSGYNQSNAYSGGSRGPMQNTEYNFATLPSPVPAATMYYDKVSRYTVPNNLSTTPNGVAGSLPANMTAGTQYSYTFADVTIAANWVPSKLYAIALLIDNNPTSQTYGQVLNSTHDYWAVGISDTKAGITGFNVYPNPATNNAVVLYDIMNNSQVAVSVFDMLGRQVYNTPAQAQTAGSHEANINLSNIANGTYTVVVSTETGKVSAQLVVAK